MEQTKLAHFRNAELWGLARWRRSHPKRYYLLCQAALEKAKLRYWTQVTFWNPEYSPRAGKGKIASFKGGYQSLDIVLHVKGFGAVVLLFDVKRSRDYPHEKLGWEVKKTFLEDRRIPFTIIPTYYASQEYWVTVINFIRKCKADPEVQFHQLSVFNKIEWS